jgi:alkanesulfonate monooxygenase SsuD/methylene tetrahydromethanopterin reductase-like flavin-dependent oxidoreductase (luciferase family)
MEYALQVVGDYDHVLAVARICEEKGAAAVSLPDHYLFGSNRDDYTNPVYDSLMQAAALGRDTAGIEIVMLVSPITFRHPAVYAKAAITIDELSGGRFVFGLGTGWHDDEHGYLGIPYPDRNERFGMLEDALGYIRRFFDDPEQGFESTRYRFEGVGYQPRARRDLRILVGGSGPKRTPRLAGTYAGELSIAGSEPEGITERVERAGAAAGAAGRNPDDLLVTITAPIVSGHTNAEITENLGRIDRNGRSGADARKAWEDRGLEFRTWEEHKDRFGRFASAGVQRSYLQLVAQDTAMAAEALEVLG